MKIPGTMAGQHMSGMVLLATFIASAAVVSAVELPVQHKHGTSILRLNSTTLHSSGDWFEVQPCPPHVVIAMLQLCAMYNVLDK